MENDAFYLVCRHFNSAILLSGPTSDHDRLLNIIALHINKIHLCYFQKCKTVCINLPGDFVSVVLHSKSNDFLGS